MKDVLRGKNLDCINVHTHTGPLVREIQPLVPDLVSLVVILADATNCEQRTPRVWPFKGDPTASNVGWNRTEA